LGQTTTLYANVLGIKKETEKLASGYQINRAGDNASGLAVSEKMRAQIGGLTQATKNTQDAISALHNVASGKKCPVVFHETWIYFITLFNMQYNITTLIFSSYIFGGFKNDYHSTYVYHPYKAL
jgi:hypothetical protein